MKKTYALYISFAVVALFGITNASQTYADSNCYPLYNGGVTNQQYCFNPTPTPGSDSNDNSGSGSLPSNQITPLPKNPPQQTKGGQPIYPRAQSKTTPNTGPADWSLPALLLIGGLGFWLRKKTKLV